MSVNPRRNVFEVYVKRGDRRWRLTASTQAQGEAIEREILEALKLGKEPDIELIKKIAASGKKTFSEVAEIAKEKFWQDTYWGTNASRQLDLMVEYLGPSKAIADFSDEDVEALEAAWKLRGNANSTMNRNKSILGKVLRYAVKRQWLEKLPELEKAKETKGRLRWLRESEEITLDKATRHFGHPDFADLWTFLIDTGARISEALKLRPDDVQNGMVTFWDTKNGDPRSVPMTHRVKAIMEERCKLPQPWPMDYSQCRQVWDRIRQYLKFTEDPEWIIHMLRHTCASRLVQRGVPLAVVQKWMGHKSLTMTLRYAHLAPDSLDVALAALNTPANANQVGKGAVDEGGSNRLGLSIVGGLSAAN
jgi:integrase